MGINLIKYFELGMHKCSASYDRNEKICYQVNE